jgi:hypothetical protein
MTTVGDVMCVLDCVSVQYVFYWSLCFVCFDLCILYINLVFWRCYESTTKNEKLVTFYNKSEDELYKSKHVVLGDHLLLQLLRLNIVK